MFGACMVQYTKVKQTFSALMYVVQGILFPQNAANTVTLAIVTSYTGRNISQNATLHEKLDFAM